jgi:hypothetical protein
MRLALVSGAVFLVVACTLPPSASAWEDDVHFGLTKWLAFKIGYTEKAAQAIARSNVETDEGLFDARTLVFWYACLSRDRKASRLTKDLHFPSGGDIPSPPEQRSVSPGDRWAKRVVNEEIERSISSESDRTDTLERFGQGVHALQDSWSHQGKPDIPVPPICSETLAYGHPAKRGGWLWHRADLTPRVAD